MIDCHLCDYIMFYGTCEKGLYQQIILTMLILSVQEHRIFFTYVLYFLSYFWSLPFIFSVSFSIIWDSVFGVFALIGYECLSS